MSLARTRRSPGGEGRRREDLRWDGIRVRMLPKGTYARASFTFQMSCLLAVPIG